MIDYDPLNTLIVDAAGLTLLLAGPVLGYRAGFRHSLPARWRVIAYAMVGGVLSGTLLTLALMMPTPRPWALDEVAPMLLAYTVGGLFLGFIIALGGVLARAAGARWGMLKVAAVLGVLGAILVVLIVR